MRYARNATHVAHGVAAAEALRGDTAAARAWLMDAIVELPVDAFLEPDRHITRTNLRIHAAWMGWDRVDAAARRRFPPHPDPDHLLVRGGDALVRAATHVHEGDGKAALEALRTAFPPGIIPIGWRFFHEYFQGRAHELLGDHEAAREHYRRAGDPRWLMFPIMTKDRVFTHRGRETVR